MSNSKVIVITGLPGSGKTTLARELAKRWHLPLIAKDLIKEPLLDVLGAADAAQSRRLSDASFAVLFDVTRELVEVGVSFLLEGNFRAGEHEHPLMRALGLREGAESVDTARDARIESVHVAQVLCRVPEHERRARLLARESDPARHAGHRLGERASLRTAVQASTLARVPDPTDGFLDVPSTRLLHPAANGRPVHTALDDWMNLREPSL